MLDLVDVGELTIESYRGTAPDHILDDLGKAADGLRGARVLHLSATPHGGGVSELLRSVVPLLNDLGLTTRASVIDARYASEAIVAAAERLDVDLIVVGSHGRSGIGRVLLGSVAEDVARRSPRPVLIVRARSHGRER